MLIIRNVSINVLNLKALVSAIATVSHALKGESSDTTFLSMQNIYPDMVSGQQYLS